MASSFAAISNGVWPPPTVSSPVLGTKKAGSAGASAALVVSSLAGAVYVYVDHAGATLYAESQSQEAMRDMSVNLYGNPPAIRGPPVLTLTREETAVRKSIKDAAKRNDLTSAKVRPPARRQAGVVPDDQRSRQLAAGQGAALGALWPSPGTLLCRLGDFSVKPRH
eukprot:SM000077S21553  [mRNA]  locus=s77:95347:99759:- [translate_table: standard]